MAPARGTPPLARLVIIMEAPLGPFGPSRAEAESTFAAAPEGTMTQVVPSAAVMRIAPQMTDSAIRARLESEAIDGVLIVERGGVGFKMTRDRPEMTCSSGTPWQCYPTSPSAQHVEWHPDRLTFRTTLWDAKTLRVIWVGRTDVYQNGASEAPYLPVLAQEVLRSLDRQRLLLPRSPTD